MVTLHAPTSHGVIEPRSTRKTRHAARESNDFLGSCSKRVCKEFQSSLTKHRNVFRRICIFESVLPTWCSAAQHVAYQTSLRAVQQNADAVELVQCSQSLCKRSQEKMMPPPPYGITRLSSLAGEVLPTYSMVSFGVAVNDRRRACKCRGKT